MKHEYFQKIHQLQTNKKDSIAINKLIDKNGKLRIMYKNDKNHAWYLAGISLYNTNDYYSALYCFKKSLSFKKDDDSCMLAIGNCYDQIGKCKKAMKWFEKSISNARDQESLDVATYNLGNSLFDQRKYTQAIECYKFVSHRNDETGELARRNLKLFKKPAKV